MPSLATGLDRNEEKSEFSAACEIEKIVRAENGLEKNENENKDGVVEHSEGQDLESRQICRAF